MALWKHLNLAIWVPIGGWFYCARYWGESVSVISSWIRWSLNTSLQVFLLPDKNKLGIFILKQTDADLGGLNSRRQSLALPVHLWQPKVMPHLDLSMALKSMVSPYLFSQQLIFLGKQIKKNKWNLYILIFSLGHSWHGIKLISQEYISNCI